MNYITKNIFIEKVEYTILIGKNSKGNDDIIKMSDLNDIWFHFENLSGPHLILKNPNLDFDKKYLKQIALNIFKYKKSAPSNSSIIYCMVKDIKLTKTLGCVITKNTKVLQFS